MADVLGLIVGFRSSARFGMKSDLETAMEQSRISD